MLAAIPSVSVIIPVYNRSNVLGRAVASILDQDCPVHEIIIVDDGSQEDISPALEPFKDQVKVVRQDNAGAAAARNTGIAHANGTWLTFLDSDDYWLPGRLSRLYGDLETAGSDVVAHIGDVMFKGPDYECSLFDIKNENLPSGPAQLHEDRLGLVISGMSLTSAAIRRTAFDAVGGFDVKLKMLEDTDLFCRLAFEGQFLVTGDLMLIVERVEGDRIALTQLEHSDPVGVGLMHVSYLEKLHAFPLSAAQKRLVNARLSGALLTLAEAQFPGDPVSARQTLLRAARQHPNAFRGWAKSILAFLLGYRLLRRLSPQPAALDRG